MVVAGPGSGKTTVITNRIWHLISQCHVPPDQILVLTFTKAAAKSLQNRFLSFSDIQNVPVTFGTFHSIFYQILTLYGPYKDFTIIDTTVKKSLFKELGIGDISLINELTRLFGLKFNNPYFAYENQSTCRLSAQEFHEIFCAYQKLIQEKQFIEFDQMAQLLIELLADKPYVLSLLSKRYKWILVDEFQDTNHYQYEFLKLISSENKNLFVVGDDDQAIYGFRGSDPSIMGQFEVDFETLKIYFLTSNYRSDRKIVDAANRIMRDSENRILKTIQSKSKNAGIVHLYAFETTAEEYQYVLRRIEEFEKQYPLSEIAIIGRTNRQLEQIKQYLRRVHIPYMEDKKEEKNRYSHVTKQIVEIIEEMKTKGNKNNLWMKMKGGDQIRPLSYWCDKHPWLFMNYLCNKTIFQQSLLKQKIEGDIEELKFLLEESKKYSTIDSYLKFLYGRVQVLSTNNDGLRLLTMHGAKGLEFTYVCLVDVNEGIIPGKQSVTYEQIEEERRLLYVGMTRAKKILDVCYLKGTKEHPRFASRFLNPILSKREGFD